MSDLFVLLDSKYSIFPFFHLFISLCCQSVTNVELKEQHLQTIYCAREQPGRCEKLNSQLIVTPRERQSRMARSTSDPTDDEEVGARGRRRKARKNRFIHGEESGSRRAFK